MGGQSPRTYFRNVFLELTSRGWPVPARCCPVVAERLGLKLVPDGLWNIIEPLIPAQCERPQGGGTR